MAHMQGRLGPMYAGAFHGWAQLIADGVKFVQKESVTPAAADGPVFRLAPVVALLPYLVVLLVDPARPGRWSRSRWTSGCSSCSRSSASAWSPCSWRPGRRPTSTRCSAALRAAAQLLGYELPFVLAAASVAMAAGTLSLTGIVEAWQPWWLLWQAPAMVVFFVAGLAEIRRPPFDMPVADSELVFGYLTEYTGLRFAFFLLAEYAGIVVIAGADHRAVPRRLEGAVRPTQLGLAVDADQGLRGGVRGHLAAGGVPAAARGPAAAAVLAGAGAAGAGAARAHRASSRW